MVYIILGKGFEETEAVAPLDILRRANIPAAFAGIGSKTVAGSHGIEICCDITVDEIDISAADMIVIPGGLGGVRSICASSTALDIIKRAYNGDKAVAAICAGPTVLYSLGILDGVNAVCYPGMEAEMPKANFISAAACTDGKIITGRGPGAALEFGFELVRYLKGDEAVKQLRKDMACL